MPRPKASTEHAAQSYEALVARLQQVVARLETGELPLAESVALYEEGVNLSTQCKQLLDTAELRVQQLLVTDSGVEESAWNAE